MTYKSSDLFDVSALTLGDTILVVRDGKSYEIDVTEAQDYGLPGDLVLVNRGGKSFNCRFDQIPEDAGITRDTDLILLNRNNKSYRATIGELRGQLSRPVTFTVSLQTAALKLDVNQVEDGYTTCPGNNFTRRCNGGRLSATVTAMSTDTFQLDPNQLKINNEWIVCCGSPGTFGFKNSWFYYPDLNPPRYKVCFYYSEDNNRQQPKGLASVGTKNIGPGEQGQTTGNGAGQPPGAIAGDYRTAGSGGFGCSPGAAGSGDQTGYGGHSQTRPRAENSGDTWNGITVTNVSFSNHNQEGQSYSRISANGKTLTGSGVIGDLL